MGSGMGTLEGWLIPPECSAVEEVKEKWGRLSAGLK